MKKIAFILTAAAFAFSSAHSAIITWSPATAVSTAIGNSSDVNTDGTLHHAITGTFRNENSSITVNGVTFDPDGSGLPGADLWPAGSSGDAAYNDLLSSANYEDFPSITFGDGSLLGGPALTDGQQYLIQVWYVDDRAAQDSRIMRYGDGEATESTVDLNDEFAIGFFTASGTTQTMTLEATNHSSTHFNAYQVRAVPVPEPASIALVFGGVMLTIIMVRRRKEN